jgi:hypothetical protein
VYGLFEVITFQVSFGYQYQVSGVRQFAHRSKLIAHGLEAGRLGSQKADSDEVFELSSIQAFQPSSYFTEPLNL